MSTSPSWFDQEKFSRLVKKVGAKPAAGAPAPSGAAAPARPAKEAKPRQAPEAAARAANRIPSSALAPSVKPSQPIQVRPPTSFIPAPAPVAPEPETEPEIDETEAVETTDDPIASATVPAPSESPMPDFPASILPPEPRSVSPLSRRTTPLPNLKSLFEYDKSPVAPIEPAEAPAEKAAPEKKEIPEGPKQIDSKTEMPESDADDQDIPWTSSGSLAEEPIRAGEPEAARPGEVELLRSQLSSLDDITQERDDARREADLLREKLKQTETEEPKTAAPTSGAGSEDLTRAIEDRDSARRDYAMLREQFELLKQDQFRLRNEGPKKDPELEREVQSLRTQIAEREEELNSLKLDPIGVDPEVDSLREEADVLQKQLNQAREEASIAQRGLALSQKALQETRDALREATEGSSQMKSSLESLKNECATLVQQNMLLQAQHDQLSREISTLRTKSLRPPPTQ
jgi:hypothetical protein